MMQAYLANLGGRCAAARNVLQEKGMTADDVLRAYVTIDASVAVAVAVDTVAFLGTLPRQPGVASVEALKRLQSSQLLRCAISTWLAKSARMRRNRAQVRANAVAAAEVGKLILSEARTTDARGKITFSPGLALRAQEWISMLSGDPRNAEEMKKTILGAIAFGSCSSNACCA